jgi:transcription elongation factor Elf1
MNYCEDCGAAVSVEFQPYGDTGYLAAITCPNCGESYDTNFPDMVSA